MLTCPPQPLPKGWQTRKLDDLAKRGSGHTPNKQKSDYWNGGIKWVSLADSNRLDNLHIFETDKNISDLGLKNSSAVLHPKGTVILSRDAGVGKSAILADDMAVSQHFMAWQCKPELDNYYLYYWLQMVKPEFERIAVGSTIKTIGLPFFKKIKVFYPPLAEQTIIRDILLSYDKSIAVIEKIIEAKREKKRALMQRLLTGKLRFPEFADQPWQEVTMDDVFKRITRRNTEVHANVVTISAQRGFVKQGEYFNKSVASETLDNYFLLNKGEFAYNKSYSNGYPMGAIKRLNNFDKGVVTTLYICFALKDETKSCAKFFEQFFEWGALNAGLTKVANEGGRAHGLLNVTPSDFFSLRLTIPGVDEQRKIAAVLSAADREIDQLTQKLAAYKLQKKGLMQQLLVGKKRVGIAKSEAA